MKCNCEKRKKGNVTTTVKIAGQSVMVKDAPALICENCGEFYLEGKYILELEKKVTMKLQPEKLAA